MPLGTTVTRAEGTPSSRSRRAAASELATTRWAAAYARRCRRRCPAVRSGFKPRRLPIRTGTPAAAAPGRPKIFEYDLPGVNNIELVPAAPPSECRNLPERVPAGEPPDREHGGRDVKFSEAVEPGASIVEACDERLKPCSIQLREQRKELTLRSSRRQPVDEQPEFDRGFSQSRGLISKRDARVGCSSEVSTGPVACVRRPESETFSQRYGEPFQDAQPTQLDRSSLPPSGSGLSPLIDRPYSRGGRRPGTSLDTCA